MHKPLPFIRSRRGNTYFKDKWRLRAILNLAGLIGAYRSKRLEKEQGSKEKGKRRSGAQCRRLRFASKPNVTLYRQCDGVKEGKQQCIIALCAVTGSSVKISLRSIPDPRTTGPCRYARTQTANRLYHIWSRIPNTKHVLTSR
jgi:hypothetical protein